MKFLPRIVTLNKPKFARLAEKLPRSRRRLELWQESQESVRFNGWAEKLWDRLGRVQQFRFFSPRAEKTMVGSLFERHVDSNFIAFHSRNCLTAPPWPQVPCGFRHATVCRARRGALYEAPIAASGQEKAPIRDRGQFRAFALSGRRRLFFVLGLAVFVLNQSR